MSGFSGAAAVVANPRCVGATESLTRKQREGGGKALGIKGGLLEIANFASEFDMKVETCGSSFGHKHSHLLLPWSLYARSSTETE
jgi:hypothetical protein